MKTTFETEEDKWYLHQIMMRALMTTENLFEMRSADLYEYRQMVIKTRAKICEYLGVVDPNQHIIDMLQNDMPPIIMPTDTTN